MKYAIKPKGIGAKPGARSIEEHYPLIAGETFSVPEGDYDPSLVLAEDSLSLRPRTQAEIDAEAAIEAAAAVEADAIDALAAAAEADAVFTAIESATSAQISAFVSTRFGAMSADQRAVITLLVEVAALTLRRGG